MMYMYLTCKAPNTTIAEFANTVDPDEPPQCLPFSLRFFNILPFINIEKDFRKFADIILSSAILALYGLRCQESSQ